MLPQVSDYPPVVGDKREFGAVGVRVAVTSERREALEPAPSAISASGRRTSASSA